MLRTALRNAPGTINRSRPMTETAVKRQKMAGPLIGTHNGHFHADEALAVNMLRLLPAYAGSPLVRTRDSTLLKDCHTVVDVGGQYDPSIRRFDHHQREFTTTFPCRKTKLSSAGLVYMHFGKSIIAQRIGLPEDSDEVARLYQKMYVDFIEAFYGNDNGISPYDTTELEKSGIMKRYNDGGFSVAAVVSAYNYGRSDPTSSTTPKTPEQLQSEEDQRFLRASDFVGDLFSLKLGDFWQAWLPAQGIVYKAFLERKQYDEDGRILVLPHRDGGLPWQEHLFDIEKEEGVTGQVLYTLFPENGEKDSKWRIRAVSRSAEGFELRKPLPEKWRGVRDDDLAKVTGIDGAVFVHVSGFIGGNKTFEGTLKMAQQSVTIL